MNAEKHVLDPAVVSGEVAEELGRIAQQMGLGAGDGAGRAVGQGARVAGSIRHQVPPHGSGM